MRDRWLGRMASRVWALERSAKRLRLRLQGRCPDCRCKKKIHTSLCPRQGQPGRRLWSQDG